MSLLSLKQSVLLFEMRLLRYFHILGTQYLAIFLVGFFLGFQVIQLAVGAFVSRDEGLRLVNQTYMIGQQGDNITRLQEFLRNEGYFRHPTNTGYFGPITAESLRNYRLEKNIFSGSFRTVDPVRCRELIRRDIPQGTRGDDVSDLQKCLIDIGVFDEFLVTGFFGPLTLRAQTAVRGSVDTISGTPSGSYSISQDIIVIIQDLIQNRRLSAPTVGEFALVDSIKRGRVNITTVNLIIEIAQNFEWVEFSSIYRPSDPFPYHPKGLAIDISMLGYQGQRYTHMQAFQGDAKALEAFTRLGQLLRASGAVHSVITAGQLVTALDSLEGFAYRSQHGSPSDISVMVTPNGGNPTARHEDHIHIDVVPDTQVNKVSLGSLPVIANSTPAQNQTVASTIQPSANQAQSGQCGNLLGENYLVGQSGDNIRRLQVCLQNIGLFSWPSGATGLFGPYTNGVYNQWLDSGQGVCEILKTKNWSQGETSPRVRRLQQCMRQAGLFNHPSNTGLFGPVTQAAWDRWKN